MNGYARSVLDFIEVWLWGLIGQHVRPRFHRAV